MKKIGTNNIVAGVISCTIFWLLQCFVGIINMFSGWSVFSKLVTSQFRDYIIFPQGYSYSQPSFVFWCFTFFSLYFCIVLLVVTVQGIFHKKQNEPPIEDHIKTKHPYDFHIGCLAIGSIIIAFLFFYCCFTLSKIYYANNLYREYCIADLTVQEKNPADSIPFKVRLSKTESIDEIRIIIDEMQAK